MGIPTKPQTKFTAQSFFSTVHKGITADNLNLTRKIMKGMKR